MFRCMFLLLTLFLFYAYDKNMFLSLLVVFFILNEKKTFSMAFFGFIHQFRNDTNTEINALNRECASGKHIFCQNETKKNRFRSTRRTQEPYPLETRLEWWNDVCCEFGKWNACLLCLKSMWTISIVFKVPSIDKSQSGLYIWFRLLYALGRRIIISNGK